MKSRTQWLVGMLVASGCWLGLSLGSHAVTYTVTSQADSGPGTLRQAILDANSSPGTDAIAFNLSNSITVLSPLNVSGPVFIDGAGTTVGAIDTSTDMFTFLSGSDNSTIKNLCLINSRYALGLGSSNNLVQGCTLGTDWNGSSGVGNTSGIYSTGNNNVIGGTQPLERNILSGNAQYGILQVAGSGLRVWGNYIGTDASGSVALPNMQGGVLLNSCTQCLVGGNSNTGEGNLISGNFNYGVNLYAATGNTVSGNIIGLSAGLNAKLSNNNGVYLYGASGNFIGLPVLGYDNIIGGNSYGLAMMFLSASLRPTGNVVQNNYIGTTAAGNTAVGNSYGIWLNGADSNLIGGNRAAGVRESNIISGNLLDGVMLVGHGNTVCGNYIGVAPDGITRLSNSRTSGNGGIYLVSGNGNQIGGVNLGTPNYGNVLSGNNITGSSAGLRVGGGTNTRIVGNYIGLNAAGTAAVGNGYGLFATAGTGTQIGGNNLTGWGNVISGNGSHGVLLMNLSEATVQGNYIGTAASGNVLVKNNGIGIYGEPMTGSLIGGTSAGEGNVIYADASWNDISLNSSSGNTVIGNYLNVLANKTPAGAVYKGIGLSGSSGNALGLKSSAIGNVIAGATYAIDLDAGSTGNGIYGNTLCSFSTAGIHLNGAGNLNHAYPVITQAAINYIYGTAQAGDYVEVFLADRLGSLNHGGSLFSLGHATADSHGAWSVVPTGLTVSHVGNYVTALGSDSGNNTSEFSFNKQLVGTILTPTPTSTPTFTPSPTPTMTLTPTQTPIGPGTFLETATPTLTMTPWQEPGSVSVYPNPARGKVAFAYTVADGTRVTINLYRLTGERVARIEERKVGGTQTFTTVWDAAGVAPGIYLCRIVASDSEGKELFNVKKKVALLK